VAGNFTSGALAPVAEPVISEADARGIGAPAMTPEERAGVAVQTQLARRYLASLHEVEGYKAAKAKAEAERDAAIWTAYQARARAAI
jgi:hypothetical protein